MEEETLAFEKGNGVHIHCDLGDIRLSESIVPTRYRFNVSSYSEGPFRKLILSSSSSLMEREPLMNQPYRGRGS